MSPRQIVQIRESLGISQQALASRMGVGVATVNRWEMGRSEPNDDNLSALRKLYKRVVSN